MSVITPFELLYLGLHQLRMMESLFLFCDQIPLLEVCWVVVGADWVPMNH